MAAMVVVGAANVAIVWDNTASWTSTTFRSGQFAPALQIQNTNANAVALTKVSFQGENTARQNLKFFLANSSGTILSSSTGLFDVTAAHTLMGMSVSWTLNAGTTYFICAMFDTSNVNYDFRTPVGTSQNGLVGLNNGNFIGFGSPVFNGTAGAEMTWRLEGAAVPEPATMAVLGLGAAAMLRRRRNA